MEQVFSKAWEYFKEHLKFLSIVSGVGIFLPMVIMFLPFMLLYGSFIVSSGHGVELSSDEAVTSMMTFFILTGVLIPLLCIVMTLTQAGMIKASLLITKGKKPTTSDLFLDFDTYVKGLGAMLLSALMIIVGAGLCILPGIIIAFFLSFVPFEIIDNPKAGVWNSIKKSFEIVLSDWKTAAIVLILGGVIVGIAANTFVGIIFAYPFQYLLNAVLYRHLKDKMENKGNNVPPPYYGQQPPNYGQQPPIYGQQPPIYGQQPPLPPQY